MSFVKSMECYFCHRIFSLAEENFPVDLYDLIVKHGLDQLIWTCKSCKNIIDQTRYFASLPTEHIKIQEKLADLTENIRVLTEEVRCNKNMVKVTHISCDDRSTSSHSYCDTSCDDSDSSNCFTNHIKDLTRSRVLPNIHSILNAIKIPAEKDSYNKEIVKSVLQLLQFHFLQDAQFSNLWNKQIYYTGSSYNNLRIIDATEYDINLILRIPQHRLKPEILDENHSYGKIKCEVLSNVKIPSEVSEFVDACSLGGYLQPEKILSWLQRQIDIVLKKQLEFPPNVTDIKNSSSGPARTIVIETIKGDSISVDLVPVFQFDATALKNTSIYDGLMRISDDTTKHKWFMVPKPCQGDIDMLISDAKVSWRLDFPDTEKILLHNKECAKNIIKILKYLRDQKDWKLLASYFIKNVVLLRLMDHSSKDYWSGKWIFERLLDAMKSLKNHLENQNLPHFLTQKNLIFKLNKDNCNNWANHLQRIITSVESNPETILNVFNKNIH